MVETVPKQINLSLYGMGKEVWLAIFLVVLITIPANLSRSTGYIPPVMHLPDLSTIRLLQGVIVIPLVEEWLFRGLLYTYLKRHLPFVWAVVANVVMFSLCHYNIGGHFLALLPHLGLGLVLVIYYERSRSIAACIVLHGVANMVPAFVFLYRVYMLEPVL
jgi:membrane protease YdiL (CAAX protease family)